MSSSASRPSVLALAILAVILLPVIVFMARRPPSMPQGPRKERAIGENLSSVDDEHYQWVDPRADAKGAFNCANCHEEIFREWSGGGHAHAATGRYFRDLYGSEDRQLPGGGSWNLLAEYPAGSGVCASCHAPTANLEETLDLRKLRGVAGLGVHCDFCHKVQEAGQGKLGLTHGRHGLTVLRPAQGQRFFGPLEDVEREEDRYSPLYGQSVYCASCHEGVVFGVHAYSTYSEWQESPAARQGKQCQSCHMKPTGRMTNIAPGQGGTERNPQTLGNHVFFAGDQAEMLRHCLGMTTKAQRDGAAVRVEVELRTMEVGHRVPTGFVDRHLLVVVEGLDGTGNKIAPLEGPRLPAAAGRELEGKAGRLYAKLLRDEQQHSPAPFWKAQPEFQDNRLRPGAADQLSCTFPASVENVRISLLYRRFWQEVARSKGWGNIEIVVREETVQVERAALRKPPAGPDR
jgi:nitrate/TMAO reductase-like tetraheme cytochrome c subunit